MMLSPPLTSVAVVKCMNGSLYRTEKRIYDRDLLICIIGNKSTGSTTIHLIQEGEVGHISEVISGIRMQ